MGIGGDDHIARQDQPLLQQFIGGEVVLAETAVHTAGIYLQHATVARGGHQGCLGGCQVARVALVKELAAAVDFFDQVKVSQNGGLFLGNLGHVGEVFLRHGQAIAVKIIIDAGAQVLLAPVDLIIFPGLGSLHIVAAADPVIVAGGVVVAVQIPLQPAQDIHLAGVALFQLFNLGLVQRGTALGHAIFQIMGGVAVPGKAQGLQAVLPGGNSNLLRCVFAVAQLGVNVHRTLQVLVSHITASFPASLYGRSHVFFPVPW